MELRYTDTLAPLLRPWPQSYSLAVLDNYSQHRAEEEQIVSNCLAEASGN